jgi:uncharacterized protein YgiM (DUF1202 family)
MLARLAAISVIAFVGLTAAASAATVAYTKGPANLREGPGTSYDVITTMPKNTEFLVEACTATWCAGTSEDGDEGFVAKSLLKKSLSSDIPFTIKIIVGPEGPFINFGDIFLDVPDEPDPDFPEVCFYQQANFKGANFCVEEGDADNDIPGNFDNNIESVLITGGLGVELCSGVGHGGECFYYTSSKKSLPSEIRNKISSYIVDDGEGGFDLGDNNDDDDEGDNIIILN